MRLARAVDPVETPLSLAEAKAHLRVDFADDDELVSDLVETATRWLDGDQGLLGRALVTQTWTATMPLFPRGRFLRLPLPPLQSVSEIAYVDADGQAQTFDGASWRAVTGERGGIELVDGASWPSVEAREEAITITFVAGYGGASSVPPPLRQAIAMMVAHFYEHREAVVAGAAVASLPLGVRALMAPYRADWI